MSLYDLPPLKPTVPLKAEDFDEYYKCIHDEIFGNGEGATVQEGIDYLTFVCCYAFSEDVHERRNMYNRNFQSCKFPAKGTQDHNNWRLDVIHTEWGQLGFQNWRDAGSRFKQYMQNRELSGLDRAKAYANKYEASDVCIVCMDNPSMILMPCGHRNLCKSCADKIVEQDCRCPMCRQVCDAQYVGTEAEIAENMVRSVKRVLDPFPITPAKRAKIEGLVRELGPSAW